MRAFIVHRTSMRAEAKKFLHSLRDSDDVFIDPIVLKKSFGSKWKEQAESKIQASEIVVVYNSEACNSSENTMWEIERAYALGKQVVNFSDEDVSSRNIEELKSAYHFNSEFDECFSDQVEDPTELLELYKIMVTSSEQLIQRRQITNGFFITVIAAIVGASGFVVKEDIISENTILVLVFPILIGLLMCRSWKNLIENYGKLNAGKFKVIHRIEHALDAQIFAAEWVALGKGVRKEKYQSFTSTEQNVPKLFSCLLWVALLLILLAANWSPIIDYLKNGWIAIEGFFASSFQRVFK